MGKSLHNRIRLKGRLTLLHAQKLRCATLGVFVLISVIFLALKSFG